MSVILVIVADQLRADHLGFVGQVPVRTPNIDRLARNGHVFNRAFAANPVCMPNRATVMTGRWPSVHGLRTNGIPLHPDAETFPRVLRRAGWRTAAIGKLHLQPMGYPYEDYQLDQIRAAMPALWQRAVQGPFGESFQSWEDFQRHADGDVTLPPDYYGFDDVSIVCGHGDRVSGNYVQWARERGFDPLAQAGQGNALASYAGWAGQVYASAAPAALHPTTYVTEEAVRRLEEHRDGNLLLYVSYPDPHHPFAPPVEYFERHSPADMPLPATFDQDHARSPEHLRRMAARRGEPDIDPMMLWAPTEEQFRHALAAELGSIEFIDDSIGRILDAVDRSASARDTVIALTSDHGDVFGDHGLILKHFTHYRGAVRVPFIISGAVSGSGVHDELVSSADLAPTLLDLANADPLQTAQGCTLRAILEGQRPAWRTGVLIEEDQPYGIDGLPGPVRIRTLVTDLFRISRYAGTDIGELYDLVKDPEETVNLFDDPSAATLRAAADAALADALMQVVDASVVPFDAA
jgi:arylsulfatase A-like enzyme